MNTAIVICGAPERPGEATRTNPLRALRLRLPHSSFPKRGASARNGLRKLAGYQLLRVRAGDRGLRSLHGPAIQFLPAKFLWDLSVPRTVFSGLHRAPALFQSSARAVAYVFQVVRSFRSPVCKYETGAVQGVGYFTQELGQFTHERH